MEPNNLQREVIGKISPKPTIVNVATAHHIDDGILENFSGWASFSAKYTPVEQINKRLNIKINEENNSDLFL